MNTRAYNARMRIFGGKSKHVWHLQKKMLGLAMAAICLSCSPSEVHADVPQSPVSEDHHVTASVKTQLLNCVSEGIELSFSELEVSIPSSTATHPNVLDFDGAKAILRLNKPSLHGLDFSLDAPFSYNGLSRYLNLSLFSDDLYFSLDTLNDASATYNVKYTANLTSYDEDGVDETTRGISYFEYGELDYFIYTILSTLGVSSIDLNWHSQGEGEVDFSAIINALDAMSEVDSTRFRVDLPIGNETLPIGLVHSGDYVLSGIEFPIRDSTTPTSYEFENGLSISAVATIADASSASYAPPYDVANYVQLIDSMALFRTIASYTNSKKFGLSASFSLLHTEDEVLGDDTHFASDAVSESAYLTLDTDLDFSTSLIDGLYADLVIGQTGGSQAHYGIYTTEVENDAGETDTLFYLDFNEIMKVFTPVDVGSALISSAVDALSDESIQNDDIMKLLNSLLSSGEGILKVIDAVKDSAFYDDVEGGYYEDILASIVELVVSDNSIRVVVHLTEAGLEGNVTILLNGTSDSAQLASITFDNVGAKADNDSKTSLYINGTLNILPYESIAFDASEYTEMTHLHGWDEEIQAIAETDQLSVTLEGYALQLGTTSVITNKAANYNRTEQGFTFSGSLSFDLKNRLGTGNMVFTDRKEAYVNDHSLLIDVTGPEGENDTDLNDMTGSGNENAMYFQYDSSNVTETSGSTPYKNENRTEPDNDALTGRFSIHSLDGILGVVQELSGTTDVRFERLTSLVSSISAETVLTKVMAGQYFELLSNGILESATIGSDTNVFVVKPGIVQQNTGVTLTIGYDTNLKPKTIEILMTLEGDEHDTEVYAKITLGEATFSGFQFASHDNSSFNDYSSIKTLAQFAIDTIMLGMTDDTDNSYTTYNVTGSVSLHYKVLFIEGDIPIDLNLTVYLKGTHVMVFGTTHAPEITLAVPDEVACNFFYETDGSDQTGGTFYLCRHIDVKSGWLIKKHTDTVTHRKVTGNDFSAHMVDWICGYMLALGDTIMDNIDSDDTSAAEETMHGEDIIKGFSVSNASLTSPSWTMTLGLEALTHVSILNDFSLTITGIQANYTGADNKYYEKNSLYSITGSTKLLLIFTLNLDLHLGNINSSTGAYTDAWNDMNTIYYTKYDGTSTSSTANGFWNGSYGKTSANSNYTGASWYTTP